MSSESIPIPEEEFILSPYLMCTMCLCNLNSETGAIKIMSHPLMPVPVCLLCFDLFRTKSSEADLEEVCSWCLDGGILLQCDNISALSKNEREAPIQTCPHSFCETCLSENISKLYFTECVTNTDPWMCLVCQPSPRLDHFTQAMLKGQSNSLYRKLTDAQSSAMQSLEDEVADEQRVAIIDVLQLVIDEIDTCSRMLEESETEAKRAAIELEARATWNDAEIALKRCETATLIVPFLN
jgi:hypothetical protein